MTKFQILSLDGGGIRGLFSAAVLANLEEDYKISLTDHFDLIVGTSTGGIIALGLGKGMKAREIMEFYVKFGPLIFPPNVLKSNALKFCRWMIRQKYSNRPLQEALKQCFGDARMADSIRPLVIPSYNIGEDDLYLFKTPHHPNFRRDWKVPLWKVAMATSAAPTFFPVFKGIDNLRLADGGVCANNPAMVGIVEALKRFEIPLSSIHVCSIGTTDDLVGRPKSFDNAGVFKWLKNDGVQVFMRGQSQMTHAHAQFFIGKDNVTRLDPPVPKGKFEIDKITPNELKALAAHASRKFNGEFEKFLGHKAHAYTPCYK